MCGRYAASAGTDDLIAELEIEADRTHEPIRSVLMRPQHPPAGAPDYNVAPTKAARVALTRVPTGEDTPVRQLRLLTWGLVPPWAKEARGGVRLTNARAETALAKPAFRAAARARRCLVPADGWYEWQASPTVFDARGRPRKQPFFVHRPDGIPLTFAGLYEFWRDPAADRDDPLAWLATFAILTTAAEPGLDRIHDRQPLVLDPQQWGAWLDPGITDADRVGELLAPSASGRFAAHPVDRAVGNSRVNGAQLLRPLTPAELLGVVDPQTGEVIGGSVLGGE